MNQVKVPTFNAMLCWNGYENIVQWMCTAEDIADREGKEIKKMIRTTSPHPLTHSTNIGRGEGISGVAG